MSDEKSKEWACTACNSTGNLPCKMRFEEKIIGPNSCPFNRFFASDWLSVEETKDYEKIETIDQGDLLAGEIKIVEPVPTIDQYMRVIEAWEKHEARYMLKLIRCDYETTLKQAALLAAKQLEELLK